MELCRLYRKKERDFTRERVLPFWQVIGLILSGHKLSLQNALNKVFKALGKIFEVPTASAYCQARQKIKAEVFIHLNKSVVADFYQLYGAEEKVELWHGHRLVGSDGTYLNLPDTKELREAFSVPRNQHNGEKQATVQALAMVLYDLLNDRGIKGAIAPAHSAEKNLLFEQLWGELKAGDVLVSDRHSADYTLIGKAVKDKIEVVIRCPRQSFKAVKDFYASAEREQIVTLSVPQSVRTQKYVKEHKLPGEIEVRLLKFKLESGEEEVL